MCLINLKYLYNIAKMQQSPDQETYLFLIEKCLAAEDIRGIALDQLFSDEEPKHDTLQQIFYEINHYNSIITNEKEASNTRNSLINEQSSNSSLWKVAVKFRIRST